MCLKPEDVTGSSASWSSAQTGVSIIADKFNRASLTLKGSLKGKPNTNTLNTDTTTVESKGENGKLGTEADPIV